MKLAKTTADLWARDGRIALTRTPNGHARYRTEASTSSQTNRSIDSSRQPERPICPTKLGLSRATDTLSGRYRVPSEAVSTVIRTTQPLVGYYSDKYGRPVAITVPTGCIGELDPYDCGTGAPVVFVHDHQDVTVAHARPEQYRSV